MKLYLVERTDDWNYDSHDAFVCKAENEESAKTTFPDECRVWVNGVTYFKYHDGHLSSEPETYSSWTKSLNNIKVTEIGTSNSPEPGVVLASFNAG